MLVIVHHHLGLGDHFVCNGLVRGILARTAATNNGAVKLLLPTKQRNIVTVKQMYADEPRIHCVEVNDDNDVYTFPEFAEASMFFRVGFEKCRKDWDVSFYDTLGVSFEERWSQFKLHRNHKQEQKLERRLRISPNEPFVVMHDSSSVGNYVIPYFTDKRVIRVRPMSTSLLDWCGLIEKADEVVCVDSSFIHLAQSLRSTGLFYDVRETNDYHFTLREGWKALTCEL